MLLVNSEHLGMSIIYPSKIETYFDKTCMMGVKQWVAQITGLCTKFGYKREFVKSQSTPISPEVNWVIFPLKAGAIYQFTNLYIEKLHYSTGYVYISPCGTLLSTIEKEEMRRLLNMPVKRQEELRDALLEARSHENKNYANDDDCPF